MPSFRSYVPTVASAPVPAVPITQTPTHLSSPTPATTTPTTSSPTIVLIITSLPTTSLNITGNRTDTTINTTAIKSKSLLINLSTGAIAGIAAGSSAILFILGFIVYCCILPFCFVVGADDPSRYASPSSKEDPDEDEEEGYFTNEMKSSMESPRTHDGVTSENSINVLI